MKKFSICYYTLPYVLGKLRSLQCLYKENNGSTRSFSLHQTEVYIWFHGKLPALESEVSEPRQAKRLMELPCLPKVMFPLHDGSIILCAGGEVLFDSNSTCTRE